MNNNSSGLIILFVVLAVLVGVLFVLGQKRSDEKIVALMPLPTFMPVPTPLPTVTPTPTASPSTEIELVFDSGASESAQVTDLGETDTDANIPVEDIILEPTITEETNGVE